MQTIYTILQLIVITFVLSDLFSVLSDIISSVKSKYKLINIIRLLLSYLLGCSKCSAFWFTFIYTQDIFIAAVTGLIVGYLKELENKYKTTKL